MSSSPAEKLVIVDDTDPRILYSGPEWQLDTSQVQGRQGPNFNGTSHITTSDNSSFKFLFNGTGVAVVGSVDASKQPLANYTCFLDSLSFGDQPQNLVSHLENNIVLCDIKNVTDGQHELEVSIPTVNTQFILDRVSYFATDSEEKGNVGEVVEIDNSQTTLSDGDWSNLDGNANYTQSSGAEMKFAFIGTSVTMVGSVPKGFPLTEATANYTIDGGSSTAFAVPRLPDGMDSNFNIFLFTSPTLDQGPHTLTVTHEGDRTMAPLAVDYFYVTNGTSVITSPPFAPVPVSSAAASPSASVAGKPVISDTAQGKMAPGTIAGAVILSVVGSIFIVLGYFAWRRKQRKKFRDMESRLGLSSFTLTGDYRGNRGFDLVMPNVPARKASLARSTASFDDKNLPPPPMASAANATGNVDSATLVVEETGQSRNEKYRVANASPSTPAVQRPVVVHEDSGMRLGRGPRPLPQIEPVEIPPTYTAQ